MNGTKPKSVKTTKTAKTTSIKNTATQTVHSDILKQVAKLQKQMELLQLENNTLKEQNNNLKMQNNILKEQILTSVKVNNTVHDIHNARKISEIGVKVNICGCKGDCSSRRCGCMKENNKCTASCKCSSEICKNQKLEDQNEELDQENKENISMNDMATSKKQEEIPQNKVAIKSKTNNLASNKNKNDTEDQFDPMKPRHQLSRTPPKQIKPVDEDEKIHMDNTYQSIRTKQLLSSPQIVATSFNIKEHEDIENVIDWMQHMAQLIPCKKCNRTFMPNRIKKHEACCKKI